MSSSNLLASMKALDLSPSQGDKDSKSYTSRTTNRYRNPELVADSMQKEAHPNYQALNNGTLLFHLQLWR
ncbi:hypothetical protein VE03_10575, partial [Pseudogymnoascus sp. 23342-1-I1]